MWGMSQTIAAVFVQLLVVLLPMINVQIGSDQLTSAIQTLTVIVTSVWIYFRRIKAGDVTLSGFRK